MDDLVFSSARSIARAIRDKDVSSREVVETHLQRIEEVNPRLNAVVQLAADRAVAEAQAADDALARGETNGPLHGVPITLKDSIDTEGIVTTGGTKGRESFVPDADATVAARMRAAGAILLGKTNTPELTLAFETDNLIYGRTNNPYDVSRTPGGSSGGAAAIVAAGGSPLDLGSDTAGSIRVPSGFCGIAGLKPTSGRVPRTGHIIPYGLGIRDSATQIGPMARFVDDLTLTLPIISGADWRDPAIVPMPLGSPGDVAIEGLRIATYGDNGIASPTKDIVDVVARAAKVLSDHGADVVEDRPTVLKEIDDLLPFDTDGGSWVRRLLERAGTVEVHPWIQSFINGGESMSAEQLTAMLERQDLLRGRMLEFMANYDAIVCPVRPFAALGHGESRHEDRRPSSSYTSVYNFTGWPGAVVRGGTSSEGLPIGVQIVARPWREDVALALAGRLEEALGGWQPPPL